MKVTVQKIKLNGLDWILTHPKGDCDGGSSIASIEQFSNGELSYAHLYKDGRIMSHKTQIGNVDDIERGELIEIEFDACRAMGNLMRNFGAYL